MKLTIVECTAQGTQCQVTPHLRFHAGEPVWLGPCVGILCIRAACEVHPVTCVALAPSFHHSTVFSCVAISQLTLSPDGQMKSHSWNAVEFWTELGSV